MKPSDQQSPHGPGIAETSGKEESQDCLTPPGISDVSTENPLETAAELKEGSSSEGVTDGALGPASKDSLAEGYFKDNQNFDPENGGMLGYGWRPAADGRPVVQGTQDQYIDKTKSPLDGFLGRTSLGQER